MSNLLNITDIKDYMFSGDVNIVIVFKKKDDTGVFQPGDQIPLHIVKKFPKIPVDDSFKGPFYVMFHDSYMGRVNNRKYGNITTTPQTQIREDGKVFVAYDRLLHYVTKGDDTGEIEVWKDCVDVNYMSRTDLVECVDALAERAIAGQHTTSGNILRILLTAMHVGKDADMLELLMPLYEDLRQKYYNKYPIAIVTSYSKHKGVWQLVVDKCPTCGETHYHGGGDGDEPEIGGHRTAHCGGNFTVNNPGYILKEE